MKKIFEYAGEHKKKMYAATLVVLISVLMGVLPFVLMYQVIAPLVSGAYVQPSYAAVRVAGVLICLALQAVLYSKGLSISHNAAYNTL
ncbi:MAG: ABC transporter ATP-binding protein, partial [Clostridiales bacterium]|nr:ABC transporter ATP-binding protein [Clostridiales bacterium]